MRRLHLILPLVATLTGAVACTESPAPVAAPAVTSSAPPSAVSPSAVASTSAGPIVLNFTAKTLTGAEFTGTSLAGKPAVLWFWSPSSTMCDEQAVGVRRAAKGFAGMVNVVGVAVEGDAAAQRQFIDKWELGGLPHLPDADGTLAKRFSITGPGTFVMIDSAGEIDEVGTFNSDRLLMRVDLLTR